MKRILFFSLTCIVFASVAQSETAESEKTPAAEAETLICLEKSPQQCFLRTAEGLLGQEVSMDPNTDKPLIGADGKYVIKPGQ